MLGETFNRVKGRFVSVVATPLSKLKSSGLSSTFAPGVAEKYHNELVNTLVQAKQTASILTYNQKILQELAIKGDKQAIETLKVLESVKETNTIFDKILNREKISKEEADQLVNVLERFTEVLQNFDKNLEVNLGQILDAYKELIKDERVSRETREQIVEEIKQVVKESQLTDEAAEAILKAGTDEFDRISLALDRLSSDATNKKMYATLRDLNKKFDLSVLENKELKDLLESEVEKGKSFKEAFLEHPEIFSTAKDVSRSLVAYEAGRMFGPVGQLIGSMFGDKFIEWVGKGLFRVFSRGRIAGLFDKVLEKIPFGGRIGGVVEGMIPAAGGLASEAGIFGKILGKVKGLGGLFSLGKIGDLLGGVTKLGGGLVKGLGSVMDFVPGLGQLLAIGTGLFGAVKGFFNANQIAGHKVGLGGRLGAAGASALSALTLGLISPKSIYKFGESVIGKISNFFGSLFGGSTEAKAQTKPKLVQESATAVKQIQQAKGAKTLPIDKSVKKESPAAGVRAEAPTAQFNLTLAAQRKFYIDDYGIAFANMVLFG